RYVGVKSHYQRSSIFRLLLSKERSGALRNAAPSLGHRAQAVNRGLIAADRDALLRLPLKKYFVVMTLVAPSLAERLKSLLQNDVDDSSKAKDAEAEKSSHLKGGYF